MARGGRKRSWRFLTGKAWAGLALISFSFSTMAIPIPAPDIKNHSIPFPCENHPCGCQSAEQCWRHCCCFTVRERWEWAKAHLVEPPDYAERLSSEGVDSHHGCATRCCHEHRSPPACDSQRSNPRPPQCTFGFSVLQCRGLATVWVSTGAVVPPPAVVSWIPCLHQTGWALTAKFSPCNVAISPIDPPPR